MFRLNMNLIGWRYSRKKIRVQRGRPDVGTKPTIQDHPLRFQIKLKIKIQIIY